MARYCGFAEEAMDSVLITLDKMDKIGFEGVEKELLENGNAPESVQPLYGDPVALLPMMQKVLRS